MKKLKVISCFLLTLLICCSFGLIKVGAEEVKYQPSIRSYDGVNYAGYLLDSNTVKTFSYKLDLTESDLETPIFQFVITPSVRGTASSYSPDFENVIFTLSDSKERSLTVSFTPRKADSPKYYYMNAMAKGENQTLLGEHQGNSQYMADPNDGEYLSDTYSAIAPYTFDGFGADSSYRPFYDKFGNTFTEGCNGLISIYYSREENALYADTGYNWVDDSYDEGKEYTLTDNYTLSKSGERRYRIRDLDKDNYVQGNATNFITTTWPGFDAPNDVTMTVSFAKIVTTNPSILLVSVGGKSIVDNYYMENHTKAVKNVTFPVPKPLFFSEGNAYDFTTYGGKVKITDSNGAVVLSERNYTDNMTFTPESAGNYSISYSITDPVYDTTRTYSYSFEALETGETAIALNAYERPFVVNESIDAGCYVYNTVQDYLPKVSLTIEHDGTPVRTINELGNKLLYQFESAGNYTFTYTSTDLLGRETEIVKNYSVSEYCLKLKDGLSENVVLNDYNDVVRPVSSDYTIINVLTGKEITPTSTSVKLSKNGGEFKTYSKNNSINGEGNYVVKYLYTFTGGSLEALRRFTVFEDYPTITINSIPNNTVLDSGSSLNDISVKVIALKGSVINIPSNTFESESEFTVNLYDGSGTLTDCTEAYTQGTLSLTLSEVKDYSISARITLDNGLTIIKNIFFTVKEGVINFAPVENQEGCVGHETTLIVPTAKDINGNDITGGSFTVSFNGKEVPVNNLKFTPANLGTYYVTYTATVSGYSDSIEYIYLITDNEAPVITVQNENKTSTAGKYVKVDDYSVSDNSNNPLTVTIEVTFNGQKVSVYNGGFDADKEGEYEVIITASDISSNTTVKTYKVTVGAASVSNNGCKSYFGSTGFIGLIVLLSLFSTVFLLIRKNNKQFF